MTSTLKPIVAGEANGLEVHWWMADDSDSRVGNALAGFLNEPLPLSESQQRTWEESGLRMTRLPASEMTRLIQTTKPLTEVRQNWFGWATEWTEVFRGRRAGGKAPLIVNGRTREVPSGVLRVIARSWGAPSARGQVLRCDIAFQVHEPRATSVSDFFATPDTVPAERQGIVLDALSFSAELESGFIYVITAEQPGTRWDSSRGAANSDQRERERLRVEQPPMAQSSDVGPLGSRILTVGEAMFTAESEETRAGPGKVLLILVPQIPGEYRLLGDPG